MKSLLLAWTMLGAVLAAGCGNNINGQCSACGSATYTVDQCNAAGAQAECKTSELSEITDSACNPNAAPKAHQACIYTSCAKAPDCAG